MSMNRFVPIPEIRLQLGYIPTTTGAMEERLQELNEAKVAIQMEIRKLLGSNGFIRPKRPPVNCRRCGHTWKVKTGCIYPPKQCPGCKSWAYWDVKDEPSVPKVEQPKPAPSLVPDIIAIMARSTPTVPDGFIGMTPPPIPPGMESRLPTPPTPLREQISYRISQREEPQPEGFVGQPTQPEPQPEVRPQVAPAALEEVVVDGGVGAPDWAEKELERLDELERIALEAINGRKLPDESV